MKKKSFLALFISAIFILSAVPVNAQSNEEKLRLWEQELIERDRLLSLCPVHNARLAERDAELEAFINQGAMQRTGAVFRTINVPIFQQERVYWCGPATARQVMHFLTGSAREQAYFTNALGTRQGIGSDVHDVGTIINRRVSWAGYLNTHANRGIEHWANSIRFSIDRGVPAILTIRTTGVAAFPYNSKGHIVNVSGYELPAEGVRDWHPASWAWIRIADPHHGVGLGNRWYTAADLFHAHATNRTHTPHLSGRVSW